MTYAMHTAAERPDVGRAAFRSLQITGTVGEWESWTGITFPESGDYVFPDGLTAVHVDRLKTAVRTGSPTSGWSIPIYAPEPTRNRSECH